MQRWIWYTGRMRNYRVLEQKRNHPAVKAAGLAAALAFAVYGSLQQAPFAFFLCILFSWVPFFERKAEANDGGIEISYALPPFHYTERWGYETMAAILEEEGARSDRAVLLFARGSMVRRLVFSRDEGDALLAAALEKNPDLYTGMAE